MATEIVNHCQALNTIMAEIICGSKREGGGKGYSTSISGQHDAPSADRIRGQQAAQDAASSWVLAPPLQAPLK